MILETSGAYWISSMMIGAEFWDRKPIGSSMAFNLVSGFSRLSRPGHDNSGEGLGCRKECLFQWAEVAVFQLTKERKCSIVRLMIIRTLKNKLLQQLKFENKGVVIYGARQVGKTTLAQNLISELGLKTLYINGDEREQSWDLMTSRDLHKLQSLVYGYELLFIDEAQRIPNIGINIKIMLDNIKGLKVLATGSSSLDLASEVSEALTGRVYDYTLYSISTNELRTTTDYLGIEKSLEERLIFGSYPEIFSKTRMDDKQEYLRNLTNKYLYKDILEYVGLKNSDKILNLLKLLAFQIGSQVSITELANNLNLSRTLVEKYLDLLQKSFIIFRLHGFARNLRKEMKKMDKIYFYDLGIRNTLIGNFNLLSNRDDVGKLWENFLVVERLKKQENERDFVSRYFWRLQSGEEIDLVEESGGILTGYEFKWNKKISKTPTSWIKNYDNARFEIINRDNWQDFVI
jgi:predicted AAA+ superfamily ATPase